MDMAIDLLFGDPRLDLRGFELDPFPAFQDRLTNSGQFTEYGPAPFHFASGRRPRLLRLVDSIRKRWRIVRVYGAGTALRMCFKRPMAVTGEVRNDFNAGPQRRCRELER